MKIGAAFSGKYLKQDHIGDKRVAVQIRDTVVEEIEGDDNKKEKKPVLYFHGKEMGLVLNQTNAGSITDALGTDETENWKNKKIVLYVDPNVMFGGKRVGGIRVAPYNGNGSAPPPPPPPVEEFQATDEDLPF